MSDLDEVPGRTGFAVQSTEASIQKPYAGGRAGALRAFASRQCATWGSCVVHPLLAYTGPGVYLQRPREGARTRSTSVGGSQDHCHGSHCARAGAADDPAPHAMQCKRLVAWQGSERAWVPGIFSIDGSLKQTRSDVRGRSSVSCLV